VRASAGSAHLLVRRLPDPSECALSLSKGCTSARFDKLSAHARPGASVGSAHSLGRHLPDPSECALSLSKGARLRTSTSSAHMLALRASVGSAHSLGRRMPGANLSGCDEMAEHCGLHRIRGCRVFWVPLNAEIPARMIL
jgi:hypothetical protein